MVKNAIDWASRSRGAAAIAGKPVLLLGATPGRGGVRRALQHAADILSFAGAAPFEQRLSVADAVRRLGSPDVGVDPELHEELRALFTEVNETAPVRASRPSPRATTAVHATREGCHGGIRCCVGSGCQALPERSQFSPACGTRVGADPAQPAGGTAPPGAAVRFMLGSLVMLLGSVLIALGSFLPWITASAVFVGTIERNGLDFGGGGIRTETSPSRGRGQRSGVGSETRNLGGGEPEYAARRPRAEPDLDNAFA